MDDQERIAKARELVSRIPRDLAVIEAIGPDGKDWADEVIELLELFG